MDARTIGSLTRALQHELGIDRLADEFGPITVSHLDKRGGIRRADQGPVVSLLQCALVFKGYAVDALNGRFDGSTVTALTTMTTDAGLGGFTERINAKTVKAVFGPDRYRVSPDGSERVREIQRWLNGSGHLRRDGVFVIACDGVWTRATHRTLIRFLQFELGFSDETATGTFGALTRQALRDRPLREGDSGVYVRFFSAALVLGGHGTFTDRFDGALAEAVGRFQRFCALPENGRGDYQTWAEALASNGDPDRPGTACDGITTITPARARALRDAGFTVIGRYLDQVPGGLDKAIKPGEIQTILSHGLRVFPISQYHGGHRDYFTPDQGRQDAGKAHDAAVRHGFNPGTVIYFAVDYDASAQDVTSHVIPYFRGVVAGLADKGDRYPHGVYGSRHVCARVSDETGAVFSFVAGMSSGYTGNAGHPLPSNWAFNQITGMSLETGEGPLSIDKNIHRPGSDMAVSSVNDEQTGPEEFVGYLDRLFRAAREFGRGNPNQLVLDALRARTRGAVNVNRDFLGRIHGIPPLPGYRDPAYGVSVRAARFAVICHESALRGQANGTGTNRADLLGWGSDVIAAYGRWRREATAHTTGYAFCVNTLGKAGTDGVFTLRDLVEDTDGHNIGTRLFEGANIVDEVRAELTLGRGRTRLGRMYARRFQGNTSAATTIIQNLLTSTDDPGFVAERETAIGMAGGDPRPAELPETHLDEFCRGVAEVLHRTAAGEITRATRPGR